MATTREHLDSILFSQDFSAGEPSSQHHLETVAAAYAFAEEGIAVISDLKEKRSVISTGPLGILSASHPQELSIILTRYGKRNFSLASRKGILRKSSFLRYGFLTLWVKRASTGYWTASFR